MPVWNGDAGGMVNTVSAFSSESQLCVRSGLWLWKPERSELACQHGCMHHSDSGPARETWTMRGEEEKEGRDVASC